MKKLILIALCLTLFSCANTRKSVQTNSMNETLVQSNESQSTQVDKLIDTTKTETGKVTITEIEFYEATDNVNDSMNDSIIANDISIDVLNQVNISGASIKSIKRTIIESTSEKKGQINETGIEQSKAQMTIANEEQSLEKIDEQPYNSYQRYIFFTLIIFAIVIIYVKRVPILKWIKKIFNNIFRII